MEEQEIAVITITIVMASIYIYIHAYVGLNSYQKHVEAYLRYLILEQKIRKQGRDIGNIRGHPAQCSSIAQLALTLLQTPPEPLQ